MSNLPAVIPSSDMVEADVTKVEKFIQDGLPGISTVTDVQMHRMLDLYLHGNTYTQIANMLQVKKVYILYFAYKANWKQLKLDYLTEIQEKIQNRVIDSQLRSKEFMLLLVQAYQKKVSNKLSLYLATDNDSHMADIDLKEVGQLMRAIEMVNELDNAGKLPNGKTPAIGLNLGASGVDVEKTGDNTISITPKKDTSVGDLLQKLADENRNKRKVLEQSDIIQEIGVKNENES